MRTSHRFLSALALTTGLVAAAPHANAWGGNGHAIVADIAQAHLTPLAAQRAHDLLALEGHASLDQVASWPDTIGHIPKSKGGAPETLRWHYVDIDVTAPHYDAARDCPDGACVVVKLPAMIQTLGDSAAPRARRLEALKWIVHLVGDLHQPLHAAERDHDKGGNGVKITYFGQTHAGHMNLHSAWDEGILEHETGLRTGPHYSTDLALARAEADRLNAAITPAEIQAWTPANLPATAAPVVEGWANESHALARDVVYADLPAATDGLPALGNAYDKAAWPVIQTRLEQAGIRLAAVLNATLDSAGASANH
ncbi:nuclease S1 [Ameyamaea chiangmaiensis NBRC 103196]|uniref:Nuclease n=1 Tax=Ameyamaea chiangmaiensis TaxID=442969 RepID=A0A850PBU9_9PROT|nr:S1/P1 nuclease [Ameyamaea chiangmaiensis]MBS4074694.1 S1/P1 nuclease [Ameyamaea chiangmaiensis]NVN40403.1 nuclease [Ameyamaea chiangmaiensis]GBQ62388.1 nuclease S1 [Ameyamaea chiangmaiensis NBRC 103196]